MPLQGTLKNRQRRMSTIRNTSNGNSNSQERGEGGAEETLHSTLAQAFLPSFSSYKVSQLHQNCCLSNQILYTHTILTIQYMQEQYILSHVLYSRIFSPGENFCQFCSLGLLSQAKFYSINYCHVLLNLHRTYGNLYHMQKKKFITLISLQCDRSWVGNFFQQKFVGCTVQCTTMHV